MRYYLKDNRLAVAREDARGLIYRYDWKSGEWVLDLDLIADIKLGEEWWDEVSESEAMHAVASRTVPVAGN